MNKKQTNKQQICVSKYVVLTVGALSFFLVAALVSNSLLQPKRGYQSRADFEEQSTLVGATPTLTPTPTPNPALMTAEPRTILAHWLKKERQFLDSKGKQHAVDSLAKTPYGTVFIMQIDEKDLINFVPTVRCFLGGPYFTTSPLEIMFPFISNSLKAENLRFKHPVQLKLSFYRDDNFGRQNEIFTYISSWQDNGQLIAHREISYKQFVSAFNGVLNEYKAPFYGREVDYFDGCGKTNFKKWEKWAEFAVDGVPQPKSANEEWYIKAKAFSDSFVRVLSPKYPELAIGSYIYQSFPTRQTQIDFYFDGGEKSSLYPITAVGNYLTVRNDMLQLSWIYPDRVAEAAIRFPVVTKSPQGITAKVFDNQTLINYLANHCTELKYQASSYSSLTPCPATITSRDGSLLRSGPQKIKVHFKHLWDLDHTVDDLSMDFTAWLEGN